MPHYFLGTDGTVLIERRANPRYEVALEIEVSAAAGGDPIRGMTRNLSESGFQVVLPTALPDTSVIDFRCPFFAGTAQAIWSREDGSQVRIGMRFVSLPPSDRDALREVIANLKRELAARARAVLR